MLTLLVSLFLLQLWQLRTSAFNLYPLIDTTVLSLILDISEDCLVSLNQTVDCDDDLFRWAVEVDNYLWTSDNVTTLCTSSCEQSVQTWSNNVTTFCGNDTIPLYSSLIPADSIAGRYAEGVGLACLRPQSNNADSTNWCMIESLDWTGSDIIRPDCDTDPTDPSCTDPDAVAPENERMANLYNNSMLCSDCFVSMLYQRLSSPYLPDLDYSDYLVGQFYDVQAVCTTTLAAGLTTRDLPNYTPLPIPGIYVPLSPPPKSKVQCGGGQVLGAWPSQSTSPTATTPTSSAKLRRVPQSTGAAPAQTPLSCDGLSKHYGVATGDLLIATGSDNCTLPPFPVCVPAPCEVITVPRNTTCDTLAHNFSTSLANLTTTQLLYWNPNIVGLCDNLTAGQYVCASAPGGTYVLPPVPPGSNGGAANAGRGGPGPVANPNGTAVTSTITTGTAIPSPTQSGVASNCDAFEQANSGDYCEKFAKTYSISEDTLYKLNPVLGANGTNCSTEFWSGYYYCVGVSAIAVTTTTITTVVVVTVIPGSKTTSTVPTPTQTGITSKCDRFKQAVMGDYCFIFAENNNISTTNLYAWNSVLGVGGTNCGTEFWNGYWYCTGVGS